MTNDDDIDYTKPPYMSRWIGGEQVPCDMCRANRMRKTPPQEAIRETYTTLGIILNLCRTHLNLYRDWVQPPRREPELPELGVLNLDDFGPRI